MHSLRPRTVLSASSGPNPRRHEPLARWRALVALALGLHMAGAQSLIRDINEADGPRGSNPAGAAVAGGVLFFAAAVRRTEPSCGAATARPVARGCCAALVGGRVHLQGVVIDPQGAWQSLAALSDGLSLLLGR